MSSAGSSPMLLENLPEVRRAQPAAAVQLEGALYVKMANTGCFPVLLAARRPGALSDPPQLYWCKWPGNKHGDQSLLHEWVVARLGQAIGAPVCTPALVGVDSVLVDGLSANGDKLPAGVYFGSLLQPGEERQQIDHVADDGNCDRFAYLLALWELCLGCDGQFLYDHDAESQVWSFDHGLWFNSLEYPWAVSELSAWKEMRWDWPEGDPSGLSSESLIDAADRVRGISEESICEILAAVPLSWGIGDDDLRALGEFLLDRKDYVASRLIASARHSGRSR